MQKSEVSIFWFRRDLRLEDNRALSEAHKGNTPVLPLFIFDRNILKELEIEDPRVTFIYYQLKQLSESLCDWSSSICVRHGAPNEVWNQLLNEFKIETVYANEDYEPYARNRDQEISELLSAHGIDFQLYKDQVIFAKEDVLKADNSPYTLYTPYKNKWLNQFDSSFHLKDHSIDKMFFFKCQLEFPRMEDIGFIQSLIEVKPYEIKKLDNYKTDRDFPAKDGTSHLSPHLRFGTVSIRKIIKEIIGNQRFLSELIWREFFIQILYHFPDVVNANFKSKYDSIEWRNNEEEFEKWKNGITGYPIVDAGMRELNATGYMHNRIRMIVAGFLCKHLLIDWRWGEAYFAEKLLDYELASNNGNWQWAAGTGCDAAPYFRVFNPTTQAQKFDKDLQYINKWVPELNSMNYPTQMVDHKMARERAIRVYKKGLN